MINGVQALMARSALGWQRHELAEASGVSTATLRRFEIGKVTRSDTAQKVEQAFTARGVEFHASPGRVSVSLKTE
jgi:transcriptional regulator with XRE-family HTH domain